MVQSRTMQQPSFSLSMTHPPVCCALKKKRLHALGRSDAAFRRCVMRFERNQNAQSAARSQTHTRAPESRPRRTYHASSPLQHTYSWIRSQGRCPETQSRGQGVDRRGLGAGGLVNGEKKKMNKNVERTLLQKPT